MTERTFTLSTDAAELPLVVTTKALEDFRVQGLGVMNDCLDRLAERLMPEDGGEAKPLDIVGQMMLDGASEGNSRKVILCALWLAHSHPEVTGLVRQGAKFRYVLDTPLPTVACA